VAAEDYLPEDYAEHLKFISPPRYRRRRKHIDYGYDEQVPWPTDDDDDNRRERP